VKIIRLKIHFDKYKTIFTFSYWKNYLSQNQFPYLPSILRYMPFKTSLYKDSWSVIYRFKISFSQHRQGALQVHWLEILSKARFVVVTYDIMIQCLKSHG